MGAYCKKHTCLRIATSGILAIECLHITDFESDYHRSFRITALTSETRQTDSRSAAVSDAFAPILTRMCKFWLSGLIPPHSFAKTIPFLKGAVGGE